MSKRMVEIEDPLPDIVASVIEDVKQELMNFLESNPDTESTPDMGGDLDYSGAIHDIIDGSVPVYTSEIRDIFYLHGDEVEQAFDDAEIGNKSDDGWPSGWKPAAVYCYIEQEVGQWYNDNADEIFDEWKTKRDAAKE